MTIRFEDLTLAMLQSASIETVMGVEDRIQEGLVMQSWEGDTPRFAHELSGRFHCDPAHSTVFSEALRVIRLRYRSELIARRPSFLTVLLPATDIPDEDDRQAMTASEVRDWISKLHEYPAVGPAGDEVEDVTYLEDIIK